MPKKSASTKGKTKAVKNKISSKSTSKATVYIDQRKYTKKTSRSGGSSKSSGPTFIPIGGGGTQLVPYPVYQQNMPMQAAATPYLPIATSVEPSPIAIPIAGVAASIPSAVGRTIGRGMKAEPKYENPYYSESENSSNPYEKKGPKYENWGMNPFPNIPTQTPDFNSDFEYENIYKPSMQKKESSASLSGDAVGSILSSEEPPLSFNAPPPQAAKTKQYIYTQYLGTLSQPELQKYADKKGISIGEADIKLAKEIHIKKAKNPTMDSREIGLSIVDKSRAPRISKKTL